MKNRSKKEKYIIIDKPTSLIADIKKSVTDTEKYLLWDKLAFSRMTHHRSILSIIHFICYTTNERSLTVKNYALNEYYPPMPKNMKWYKIYPVFLILVAFSSFGSLDTTIRYLESGIVNSYLISSVIISITEIILMIYLVINMPKLRISVYYVHQSLMIIEYVVFIFLTILTIFNAYTTNNTENLLDCIVFFIKIPFCILNYSYFYKRKYLFVYPTFIHLKENTQKKKCTINKKQPPCIDIPSLAFSDNDTIAKATIEYQKNMELYVKQKLIADFKKKAIILLLIIVTIAAVIGIMCYNKGFKDNQPIAKDRTPIVYVTKSGTKYHKRNCDYISNTAISISTRQAQQQGYTPCSRCY